ncbi:hypothetical protein [Campylobacter corcagiensis]|uniref:Uncharacterized protein n=1 Tax=Campylobacter corcagiensis TaxID=1448857 RepID=A0A7M1LGU2_9BACT|nr:hypothetical protein [Campylobacter corcagiensis]QKF64583.1 hypothetical protein CCORG_0722 [Campylobacter corcagiensis]QOQ87244.1 hypothetical protein IMC76_08560 [Campylobacter corcagiensis]
MANLKKKTEHADEQIKNTNPSGENERDWADDAIDITTGVFDKYLPGVDGIGNPTIKDSKNTLKNRKVDDYNRFDKLDEIEKQSPRVNWGNSNAQPTQDQNPKKDSTTPPQKPNNTGETGGGTGNGGDTYSTENNTGGNATNSKNNTNGYQCNNSISWGGGTDCEWFELINKYLIDEYDPLVLDLNSDSKISIINRDNSNSYFNHDGNNVKYKTS